jgi:hypothetical protein
VLSLKTLKFVLFEHNRGTAEAIFALVQRSGMRLFGLPHRWWKPQPQLIHSAADMARYGDFLATRVEQPIL